jgi:hypothetical protein
MGSPAAFLLWVVILSITSVLAVDSAQPVKKHMYLVAIGWLYVALMMSVAEATHSQGSVLGAIVTFVLYGLAPVALLMYILGTPARKRAIRAREAAELARWREEHPAAGAAAGSITASLQPDAGAEAAAGAVPPVRKVP